MDKNIKKKIRDILNDYNIEDTPSNFNTIAEVLFSNNSVEIYKKILQLARLCIITNENFYSITCEIEIRKNKQLLEDIQKLFFIVILNQLQKDLDLVRLLELKYTNGEKIKTSCFKRNSLSVVKYLHHH